MTLIIYIQNIITELKMIGFDHLTKDDVIKQINSIEAHLIKVIIVTI